MNRISVKCVIFLFLLNTIICYCKKYDRAWQTYKKQYNKQYNSKEEETRRIAWEKTHRRILKHNKKYDRGETSFAMGHNRMSDRTDEERSPLCMLIKDDDDDDEIIIGPEYDYENYTVHCDRECQRKLPKHVDWREKNVITPIKDQGDCSSCYAFGTIAAMEAAYALASGKLVSFSEQEIVDCSTKKYGNSGCHGGGIENTLEYIWATWGISSAEDYPYKDKKGKCRVNPDWKRYDIDNYLNLKRYDEDNLRAVVALKGPVAASVTASAHYWFNYKHGILGRDACDYERPNHVVAVIGYGVANNTGYWLIKNSMGGEDWGQKGYAWILRDGTNVCEIAGNTFLPTVTMKPFN